MRFGKSDEELESRVAQLEAAVHALVRGARDHGSPTWMRHSLPPTLEVFVTYRDMVTGRPTRVGVGDKG